MLPDYMQRKEVKLASLNDIIQYINPDKVVAQNDVADVSVEGVSYNSTTVKQGDIFVCLVGGNTDSHKFAVDAQSKGAVAILSQRELPEVSVPVLVVKDTKYEMAKVASLVNGFPSKSLRLVGVTGTNGKTTVTHLIENILEQAGIPCGLIGTLGQRMSSKAVYTDAKHTTPQAPDLQKTFKTMLDEGIKSVVMEVSSHALEQHRVGDCQFTGAVFTNLTQDHLDYHITMENYFKAKSKLFSALKGDRAGVFAVINRDDENAERFISVVQDDVYLVTYGINNTADVMAKNIEFSVNGASFDCVTPTGETRINLQMTGLFSIYNALAALSAGLAEGIPLEVCIRALESTRGVAGRFEAVSKEPLVIVDYAHTPDGLENVLNAARKIVPQGGQLLCVFGCGGDRDATKRPKMGHIAETLADKIIVTSDNPRSEDPQQIITDILTGIKSLNSDKVMVEIDRRTAIEIAVSNAKEKDIVLIAGKGHEDYQILKDKTIHFDDREEAKLALEKIRGVKA